MKNEMITFDNFIIKAEKLYQDSESLEKIRNAYEYAKEQHAGKKRLTNEDYITHPLNVANILLNLNVDVTTILGALLHETINNGNATEEDLEKLFGKEIKNIVVSISKINRLELQDNSDSSAIYLRKVLVGLSEDVRILYIKLADRLHNMRTIWAVNEKKQKRKANETMTVLVPIAHRLGINSIKSELEDICLRYLKPEVYRDIEEKLATTRAQLNASLNEMKEQITDILAEHDLQFEIKGRVKSVYSIYNKLNKGKKWNDIYDFLALRVILEKESDCYLAVGLVHSKFRPIPKRFKDYIAMPKENMYQSLHTTVFGVDGNLFEVQFRTFEMDEIAEKGLASHWSYKEKGTQKVQNIMEQKLEMFRSVIEANEAEESDSIFANEIKNDFLSELIYVFTPKGDVVELPKGSTPIDFAYRIHSNVGDKTVGAIVNEVIVPLTYELQDNDIVKIKTNNNASPNKDWLNIVKTSQAKSKIKAYFSKQDRVRYIEKGKEILEKELRKKKLVFNEILSDKNIEKICKDLKLKDLEDIYLSLGSLRYTAGYIINLTNEEKHNVQDALIEKMTANNYFKKSENYKSDIIVAGTDDILVSLAKCCHPVKGDEIKGYITKGEGIVVHKINCPNIVEKNERLVNVSWNDSSSNSYFTSLIIEVEEGKNYLLDILTIASMKNIIIDSAKTINLNNKVKYEIVIKVKNNDELNKLKLELERQKFVIKVI